MRSRQQVANERYPPRLSLFQPWFLPIRSLLPLAFPPDGLALSPSFLLDPGSASRVVALSFRSLILSKKLYVGNLTYNVNESDLGALFEQARQAEPGQARLDHPPAVDERQPLGLSGIQAGERMRAIVAAAPPGSIAAHVAKSPIDAPDPPWRGGRVRWSESNPKDRVRKGRSGEVAR
jgi:hypothetical protein